MAESEKSSYHLHQGKGIDISEIQDVNKSLSMGEKCSSRNELEDDIDGVAIPEEDRETEFVPKKLKAMFNPMRMGFKPTHIITDKKAPAPITIKLGDKKKDEANPALAKTSASVASAFNQESDEEEEMPPEAKMRMRNIGSKISTHTQITNLSPNGPMSLKGRALEKTAKVIIMNVYNRLLSEHEDSSKSALVKQTKHLTGVSQKTIYNLLSGTLSMGSPNRKRKRRSNVNKPGTSNQNQTNAVKPGTGKSNKTNANKPGTSKPNQNQNQINANTNANKPCASVSKPYQTNMQPFQQMQTVQTVQTFANTSYVQL